MAGPLHCARPSLPTSRELPAPASALPSCYCLTSVGNLGLHPLAAAAAWSVVAGHNAFNGRCDGRSFSTCWAWSLRASIRVSAWIANLPPVELGKNFDFASLHVTGALHMGHAMFVTLEAQGLYHHAWGLVGFFSLGC